MKLNEGQNSGNRGHGGELDVMLEGLNVGGAGRRGEVDAENDPGEGAGAR